MIATTPRRWRRVAVEVFVVGASLCDIVVGSPTTVAAWVAAAGALTLPLRHRFPILVLLATLPGVGLRAALLPAWFALYHLCRERGNVRDVVPWASLTFLAFLVPWPPGPRVFLNATLAQLVEGVLYAVAFSTAPGAIGLFGATTAELQARLRELHRTREREQRLQAAQAVTAERARIAREMHDVVAHEVSLIAVQAGALQVSTKDEDARRTAAQLRRLSVRTLTELRAMVGFLRAAGAGETDLAPQPKLADLGRLTGDAGFDVTLAIDEALRDDGHDLPAPVQRAAYRTVQEGLTNVRKHAAGAPATVTIGRHGSALTVEVVNAAPREQSAPRLPSGGHGLVGLRERASMLGGAVTSGPTADGGYRLRATFPVAPVSQS